MPCIETQNLNFRFPNKEQVLNNINLLVPDKAIYGFLGPNGAGKTTTLRLLLGLLKKQSGNIRIFNKNFDRSRIEILQNIGSLIESPSLYPHLTAVENLAIYQNLYRCSKSRISEVLKTVGLSETKNKRAGQFSLGMKQRLSIAVALLHRPSLLVLDEPTNGLDPNGIIEIRELLKNLNSEQNTTIVVSSHLLLEIEKLVTHVGIINKGNLLFQGTLNELHLKQNQTSIISIETNNIIETSNIIKANNLNPTVLETMVTIPWVPKEIIAGLVIQLVSHKIGVFQISEIKNDLESIFIDITKN